VKKQKIQKIIDLLKFLLSIDDQEIIRSSIESIVEDLEELNK
jgi:hypothetical protein